MALICPVCSAENREGAHFCRSCGGKLAPAAPAPMVPAPAPGSRSEREWAATAPAQLRAPTIPGGLFEAGAYAASAAPSASARLPDDDKTVIVLPGSSDRLPSRQRDARAKKKSSSSGARRRSAGAEAQKKALRSRGMWLWGALLAVGLLMIAAGWYGYGTSGPSEATPPAAVRPEPAAAPASLPGPAAALPEPPAAEAPAAETAASAPATDAPAAANPKPPPVTAKSRKPAPAALSPSGATEPAPAPAVAPPSSPAPAAPADPLALCGDRNFIAKAQCMAAQCVKPEYRAHAQCEAVRRQQRIEEEKRNPTLSN
ncbi:zinc ribbon domain-containing protein [Variovorax paradoxus]|uniref:zinc ribbon domain-containing protein n=1 Tax=Variovorax paradoxus TaxID=34073 RepID=UPI0027815293|nr:zinc ribbon domain-containing protein [Variovorax paradoxus]MDQ0588437.1 hypothetical protein [Variovorax paradoxus]